MSESEQNSEKNSRQIKRRQKSECPVFFQTVKKFLVKSKDVKTPECQFLQTVEKILVKFKDVKIQMVDHHFELAGKNRKES